VIGFPGALIGVAEVVTVGENETRIGDKTHTLLGDFAADELRVPVRKLCVVDKFARPAGISLSPEKN
jgi:hypothetical protein